jgi:hypothetical protein
MAAVHCALKHNLPDIGRVGLSPFKLRVPPPNTIQGSDVRVLDEPSMVGLMVWSELLSWQPGFGQSIMMVKASDVKMRAGSKSGFQPKEPCSAGRES